MNRIIQHLRYRAFMAKEYVQLAAAAWDDLRRYAKYSFTGFSRRRGQLGLIQGRLMASCHVLEKGLSMPECRALFGKAAVQTLYRFLLEYEAKGGQCSDPHFRSGLEALQGYIKKHQEMNVSVDDVITPAMRENLARWQADFVGPNPGVLSFTPETFFAEADAPFGIFCGSRHSCRHFDPSLPVDPVRIREAVRSALRTPSGCNRQPWRVHAITGKTLLERCVKLHGGSRGFNHLIPVLLIVSARIDVYGGSGERNQTYVDGSLFAMNLMLGLHHQRLGCVPLNWSVTPRLDRQLKAATGIPPSENILMLLGIGHPVEQFTVPQSTRRSLEEVLVFHGDH